MLTVTNSSLHQESHIENLPEVLTTPDGSVILDAAADCDALTTQSEELAAGAALVGTSAIPVADAVNTASVSESHAADAVSVELLPEDLAEGIGGGSGDTGEGAQRRDVSGNRGWGSTAGPPSRGRPDYNKFQVRKCEPFIA